MSISERIKQVAESVGLNITATEKACGLSQGSIMKWKVSSPKVDNLAKIADYFNVSVDYLLGREVPNPLLSEQEQRLLTYYRNSAEKDRNMIMGYAEAKAKTKV